MTSLWWAWYEPKTQASFSVSKPSTSWSRSHHDQPPNPPFHGERTDSRPPWPQCNQTYDHRPPTRTLQRKKVTVKSLTNRNQKPWRAASLWRRRHDLFGVGGHSTHQRPFGVENCHHRKIGMEVCDEFFVGIWKSWIITHFGGEIKHYESQIWGISLGFPYNSALVWVVI